MKFVISYSNGKFLTCSPAILRQGIGEVSCNKVVIWDKLQPGGETHPVGFNSPTSLLF